MTNAHGPKRRTHVLPRYYLKGFSEDDGGTFIWEYRRGLRFQQGHIRGKHNPCRVSIRRQASVEKDFYAFPTIDGQIEFDVVENTLEKLEKPIVPVIAALRNLCPIGLEEKSILADYVFLMRQRVPSREKRASELMDRTMKQWPWDDLMRKAAEEGRFDLACRIAFDRESMVNERRSELMARGTTIQLSNAVAKLSTMTWSFLVARSPQVFVTTDDPVLFPDRLGLKHPKSWLLFPISSRIALLAAWIEAEDLAFKDASPDLIASINDSLLERSYRFAYAAQPESWIADRLEPESPT